MRALVSAFLLALGFALTFSSVARAIPLTAPAPPGAPLAAGRVVETRVPPLPEGVEEFELFLVPDAGPALRLCAEQPAGTRTVRWRVPAISARSARLVMRAGTAGGEWESPPSAAFALAPLPGAELERARSGRSEAGYALGSTTSPAEPRPRDVESGPQFDPADTPECAGESSPAMATPRVSGGACDNATARGPERSSTLRFPSRIPAFRPLRN